MCASLGVCLLSAWLHSVLTHRCNVWMYSSLSKDASAEYSEHVEMGQRIKRKALLPDYYDLVVFGIHHFGISSIC